MRVSADSFYAYVYTIIHQPFNVIVIQEKLGLFDIHITWKHDLPMYLLTCFHVLFPFRAQAKESV